MQPEAPTSNPLPAQAPVAVPTSTQSDADDQNEQHIKQTVEPGSLSLEDALKMFDDAKTYVNGHLRTNWDNYFKVYKGKRVIRNYEGVADPVIRESHTIIETLVANIAGGDIKFHFVRTNEEQAEDTEVINEMLDYYMICNSMGLKTQEWVREMLLYGTAILGVEWREGEPFIFNIALRDFFVDPTSTGLTNTLSPARYAGYEYLASKAVLKREKIYDAEKNAWVDRYTGLDNIGIDTSTNSKGAGKKRGMDKAFKDLFNGSTLGEKATEDQIHVIKLYDLDTGRCVEIGNRKAFIYDQPTWCQREEMTRNTITVVDGQEVQGTQTLDEIKPFLPFAVLRDYIDSSQFYASGEMELLINDAELLNDYEAMQVDNNAYQNTPMYWIDPQFADLAPEIETIPGAVYPIPRNAMGALERPQLSTDIDNKEDRILERMRRATAADEAVQGVGQAQSRTTATEVSTQLTQAQTRFSTKIQNLEQEGFAQLALIIFKLVQIFVTKKTATRIVGKNGVFFKDFDPWDYNGKWEAHAELDSTIKKQQMEVGQKDNQIYQILSEDPQHIFNPVEIKRWMIQKIDPNMSDEAFNKLLAPPTPPAPSPEELKGQADIQKSKIAAYGAIYRWSPPDVQAQIEANIDITPSQLHAGDAHNKVLEQANIGADHMNITTDATGKPVPGMDELLKSQPNPAGAGTPQPAMA
jgi:hypothetical protein